MTQEEMQMTLDAMGEKALSASRALAVLDPAVKSAFLLRMADLIESESASVIEANCADLEYGREKGLSDAMLDRLRLDEKRVKAMADGVRTVAAQEDPVGRVLEERVRPNGLHITKVSVPFGVIGIIYESRPNVTVDAAAICLKAGNAVMLRGGSEAFNSNMCLAGLLDRAAVESGIPSGAVQLIPWRDREAVKMMLKMDKVIDLIIPRGGEGLVRMVTSEALMPVLKHYKGVCHLFVDEKCNIEKAVDIVVNAKCQRPGTCNALETLLIDRKIAAEFVPFFAAAMRQNKVELRGDEAFCRLIPDAVSATDEDFFAEFLNLTLAVRIVDGVEEAVKHINKYGSRHSDGIISEVEEHINYFFGNVDSSTLYANASTRFTDGGEFGMGAEIGISTDKLHARGPMGVDELTTYKYLVRGDGQVRG
ncbi:MAG: glutamate-5-semialdehyde dehydrogenase [Lentisphaeria bacterium]|nr:glutamate-5-semialdehyde dehydrogenase [Lentisphaeria bacterium]